MKQPKKIVVNRPPPILRAIYQGTSTSIVSNKPFEKLSDPAPSAGRGAFLMDEYYSLIPIALTY